VERPGSAGAGAGCRTYANNAHGQAYQCRFSLGRLDAAYQHHDAGTGHYAAARAAFDRVDTGCQCTTAFTPSGRSVCAGCGKEAGRAEIRACAWAGSACTRHSSAGARGLQRLMVSGADRNSGPRMIPGENRFPLAAIML
jgi:hypothetical protein